MNLPSKEEGGINLKNKNGLIEKLILGEFIGLIIVLIIGTITLYLGKIVVEMWLLGIFGLCGFCALLAGTSRLNDNINSEAYDKKFTALVDESELEPENFVKKLNALNRLGNLYLFLLITLIILSFIGIIMIGAYTNLRGAFGLLIAALVGMLYVIVKSLFTRNSLPDMPQISRKENPLLFEIIDEAAKLTDSKKIDYVYLNNENICAVSRVTVGLKKYDILTISIYHLELLDEEELKSVLLHEFAHISNKDTKISQKFSVNLTRWINISLATNSRGNLSNILLGNFASYYVDKLNTYHEVTSKHMECLADKTAIEHTSSEIFASANAKVYVITLFLDERLDENDDFSEMVYKSIDDDAPPKNYYNLLFAHFYETFDKNPELWLSQIQKCASTKYDSHPTFSERLKAVGIERFTDKLSFNKRNKDYKKEIDGIMKKANAIHFEEISSTWEETRKEHLENKKLIEKFTETENEEKTIEYGIALEDVGKTDEALAVYDKIIGINPSSAGALFRKGQILLIRQNEEGIDLIKKAINLNVNYAEAGLPLIENYLVSNGMTEKKTELDKWAWEKIDLHEKCEDELNNLYLTDEFIPCDLSNETIEKIKNIFKDLKGIKEAYLVKKVLQYSNLDFYILAVKHGEFVTPKRRQENLDSIVEKVTNLNLECFLLDLDFNIKFRKIISSVENSRL